MNNMEKFKKTTCVFKSRQPLAFFLLNVILNIEKFWKDFCYCTETKFICSVCQMRVVYINNQYDLYQNSFDLDFLIKFHGHLVKNLYKLIEIECHFACKVINEKYFYTLEDLFDGSKKHYYLYDCLNDFENKKIIQIKNTDFKIIL